MDPHFELFRLMAFFAGMVIAFGRDRDWKLRALWLGDPHRGIIIDYAIILALAILAFI